MKRLLVLSSVLLLGGVVGCVGQDDLQALRADVMALSANAPLVKETPNSACRP